MTKEDKYDAYLARQRQYSRNYRKAHKAECAAYYKQWYQKNKAQIAAKRREQRLNGKMDSIEAK